MTRADVTAAGLAPVPLADDEIAAGFASFRLDGLRKTAQVLRSRLGEPEASWLAQALTLASQVSFTRWADLVLTPHYSWWWHQLGRAIHRRDARAVGDLIPELSRLLLAPLLRDGIRPDAPIALPAAVSGELRIPGSGGRLDVSDLTSGVRLSASITGDTLLISDASSVLEFGLARFRADPRGVWNGEGRACAEVPGTTIDVDNSDPWIADFLAEENATKPSPGRSRDDMRLAALTGQDLRHLATSLELLAIAWPQMHREVLDYVRLIVPFSSAVRAAFTNTAWQGAVFLRATMDDPVANLERIVHETSHLRLNVLMTQRQLHEHGWNDLVQSPFRAGQRPVTGLYHGAVVVTRAATALSRVHHVTGKPAYAARVPVLLAQVVVALETLFRDVRLTADGIAVLEEARQQVSELAALHGVADATAPAIYAEL